MLLHLIKSTNGGFSMNALVLALLAQLNDKIRLFAGMATHLDSFSREEVLRRYANAFAEKDEPMVVLVERANLGKSTWYIVESEDQIWDQLRMLSGSRGIGSVMAIPLSIWEDIQDQIEIDHDFRQEQAA